MIPRFRLCPTKLEHVNQAWIDMVVEQFNEMHNAIARVESLHGGHFCFDMTGVSCIYDDTCTECDVEWPCNTYMSLKGDS